MATETDELPAGRKLDALIAAKVMGWDVRGPDDGPWVALAENGRHATHETFRPSTDIAAAWEVVEHFANYKWLAQSASGRWGTGPMMWECAFASPASFQVVAETAPLAICRAALRAKAL